MNEINENDYMQDAEGRLIPVKLIRDIDRQRDNLVKELFNQAATLSTQIKEFKKRSFNDIAAHVSLAAEKYNLKIGGEKGNVTLTSYDGQYKIIRSYADKLDFNEGFNIAREKFSICLGKWSKGVNINLVAIINKAFKRDKEGRVSTAHVMNLINTKGIDDPDWNDAIQAIRDCMSVQSTKAYIRYQKRQVDGSYKTIPLDIAADFDEPSPEKD